MISAADCCQLQVSILICYHIAAEKGATLYKNIILSWQLCFKLLYFLYMVVFQDQCFSYLSQTQCVGWTFHTSCWVLRGIIKAKSKEPVTLHLWQDTSLNVNQVDYKECGWGGGLSKLKKKKKKRASVMPIGSSKALRLLNGQQYKGNLWWKSRRNMEASQIQRQGVGDSFKAHQRDSTLSL